MRLAKADAPVNEKRVVRAARVLTEKRARAARRLGPSVEAELKPLALGKARFSVVLSPTRESGASAFSSTGAERAEFHLAAHPGDARADEVAYQLGEIHETANRPDQAIAEYQRALASKPGTRLATEVHFRLGRLHEQKGEKTAALRAYEQAALSGGRGDAFRLSAVARCAALYEAKRDFPRAVESYRDLMRNAEDREIKAAASTRVAQLQTSGRR